MFKSTGSTDHSTCCSLLGNSQGFDSLPYAAFVFVWSSYGFCCIIRIIITIIIIIIIIISIITIIIIRIIIVVIIIINIIIIIIIMLCPRSAAVPGNK
jgi:hypothetical protein